jgi:hypothetical protein
MPTKFVVLNMNLFLTLLNLPPQTLMSWNGLRPFPTMLGVSGLARPNVSLCAPCGALPNIIGWGFTMPKYTNWNQIFTWMGKKLLPWFKFSLFLARIWQKPGQKLECSIYYNSAHPWDCKLWILLRIPDKAISWLLWLTKFSRSSFNSDTIPVWKAKGFHISR